MQTFVYSIRALLDVLFIDTKNRVFISISVSYRPTKQENSKEPVKPYKPSMPDIKPVKSFKPSFSDAMKKKYGSRKSYTSTEEPVSTEKVTYPPRPTTTLKYSRFVPTVKPFTKPKFKRVRTTTLSTSTTELETTTTVPTTTTQFVISNYPEPSLDTSLFGGSTGTDSKDQQEPEFDNSYFDLEKNPATNSMSVDTSSFELDSMNFDDGENAMAQTDTSSQTIVSKPFKSTKMSPVPIRKVLDIFQELRLSFGRDQSKR